jgi:hypothetical protein
VSNFLLNDSTCGLSCAIRSINVEQDHDFTNGGRRALHRTHAGCRAIVHSFHRVVAKSVSIGMLRQQNMLRYIAKEHSASIAATREK